MVGYNIFKIGEIMTLVLINYENSINSVFKKLQSKMNPKDAQSFKQLAYQCVNMNAKNKQTADKDLAILQLCQLANRYGVKTSSGF